MATAMSIAFKKRMMQLQIAVRDPQTLRIYLGEFGQIHDSLIEKMNQDRRSRGLSVLDLPEFTRFDDWEGRGYIRKDTGEFMQAQKAVDWASALGYGGWKGESIDLRRKQGLLG